MSKHLSAFFQAQSWKFLISPVGYSNTSHREKKLYDIITRLIVKGRVLKKSSFSEAAFINKTILIREEHDSKAM